MKTIGRINLSIYEAQKIVNDQDNDIRDTTRKNINEHLEAIVENVAIVDNHLSEVEQQKDRLEEKVGNLESQLEDEQENSEKETLPTDSLEDQMKNKILACHCLFELVKI